MACLFISPVGFPLTDSTVILIAERNPHCWRPCIGTPARTHVCKIPAFWRGHGDGKDSVNLTWTRVSSHDHDIRHSIFDDLPCMAPDTLDIQDFQGNYSGSHDRRPMHSCGQHKARERLRISPVFSCLPPPHFQFIHDTHYSCPCSYPRILFFSSITTYCLSRPVSSHCALLR